MAGRVSGGTNQSKQKDLTELFKVAIFHDGLAP